MILVAGSLTKTIDGLVKAADTGVTRTGKALRNFHVNFFLEVTMKKCVVDIQLVKMPSASGSNSNDTANNDELGYWDESVMVINAFDLGEAFRNETSLVALNRPIRVELDLEDPFTLDNLFTRRKESESPGAICFPIN
ncbi:unnamed protein product [Linum trigynum]|uniref:Uncharacterized protein n=1 Tax=Linum trigynum TaxID=586398 RepID=A0AAV2D5X2_9ROSI